MVAWETEEELDTEEVQDTIKEQANALILAHRQGMQKVQERRAMGRQDIRLKITKGNAQKIDARRIKRIQKEAKRVL